MDISTIKCPIEEYLKLSEVEKENYIKKRLGEKREEFIFRSSNHIPLLIHKKWKLEFVYVPEGKYLKGFTKENQLAAEKINKVVNASYSEMRPVSIKNVGDFLITRTPVLDNFQNLDYSENIPLYCSYEYAEEMARKTKMRLPNETEWEYFARAGSESLFPFGDNLLEEKELEKWMPQDFRDLSKYIANRLGIYGLFTGEWTSDFFQTNYCDNAEILTCKVIRGGGAMFWPWQDQEWVWCMSAMRMPSDDLIDNSCAFRLVFDIC